MVITFDTLNGEIDRICKRIVKSRWQPDYIVGLSRGGLVPGVMISHWLNVSFKPLEVSLRDGGYCKSSKFFAREAFGKNEDKLKKNILIVDDIMIQDRRLTGSCATGVLHAVFSMTRLRNVSGTITFASLCL